MGFNYGKERYRTEKEFARFARACRGAGMPEDAIAEMYQYDREALNSDRRYYTHTQPFDGAAFSGGDDEEREEGRSPLYKNCLAQCSVRLEIRYSGRYGWLEDIDTPALVLWLKALSDDDLELLMYVFRDGHTEEVAWQNPSRRESWSDEMKQTARERQLRMIERRRKDDSSD